MHVTCYPEKQASEREGKGKDERVKREKIGRGRIALILTFLSPRASLPFYGLPHRLPRNNADVTHLKNQCFIFKTKRSTELKTGQPDICSKFLLPDESKNLKFLTLFFFSGVA